MRKTAIVMIAALTLTACKKKKQYSYWKINGVAYSSSNVTFVEGYDRRPLAMLVSHDHDSRFDLRFSFGYLPGTGSWPMATVDNLETQNPDIAKLSFYVGAPPSVSYVVSKSNQNTLQATERNGKAQYVLPPTWFVNYNNPNDSVLIEGTLNYP